MVRNTNGRLNDRVKKEILRARRGETERRDSISKIYIPGPRL